jgi:ferric-dicitrate binding protein FerR (iron transport regulator)
VQQKRFKRILKKYHEGKASDAERYFVDCWYDSFSLPEEKNTVPPIEDADATGARILSNILTPVVSLKWHKRPFVIAAAAVLLACAVVTPVILNRLKPAVAELTAEVMRTGEKQVKKILLPDSTLIWLNANSSLVVEAGFGEHNRQVRLEGEAFFEVGKDAAHPFMISTGEVHVKVLGTSFNIQSYDNLSELKVEVSSGKVQVSDDHSPLAVLTPGQGLTYNRGSKQFKVDSASTQRFNSWTDGNVVLEKASFEYLCQVIYNLYGTTISSDNKQVRSFRYNLTFRAGLSEKEAISLVVNMLKKNYKKEGSHVTIF